MRIDQEFEFIDFSKGQNQIIDERDDYAEDLKEKDDEGYEEVVDK